LPLLLGPLPAGRRIPALEARRRLVEAASAVGIEPAAPAAVRALRLHHLDVRLGQLVDEPRGRRRLPEPAVAPVLREADLGLPPRPRKADVGEPALLLQPRRAVLIQTALVREQAFLPARQEHHVELQPLG